MSFNDILAIIKDEQLRSITQPMNKEYSIRERPSESLVETTTIKKENIADNKPIVASIADEVEATTTTVKVTTPPIGGDSLSKSISMNLPDTPVVPGAPLGGRIAMVSCSSTKGPLKIAIHEDWAPLGSNRFIELVESNFFETQVALFRAIKGWLVQFGISGDPAVTKEWRRHGNIKVL